MSYFNTILTRREITNISNWHGPLWTLKITDTEYQKLKELLQEQARSYRSFYQVTRECALFFAEYWKREYAGGPHTIQMVSKALGIENNLIEFYNAAKWGAESLALELYRDNITRYLDSLLYQGGLPMKLLLNGREGKWNNFARGLINRRVDFENLNLGEVARNSDSIRGYCRAIMDAIDNQDYNKMPFSCENANDDRYLYLINLAQEEHKRQWQKNPFRLYFEFDIDSIEKEISIYYHLTGRQSLSAEYLNDNGLNDINFFSLCVYDNDAAIDTFEYLDNYCWRPVESRHRYVLGNTISLMANGSEDKLLMSSDISLDVPRLLYREGSTYRMGNKIGVKESIVFFPEGWHIIEGEGFRSEEYKCITAENPVRLNAIRISADFRDTIALTNGTDKIRFGCDVPIYWTEVQTPPMYNPDIEETLYDAERCRFLICHDADNNGGVESIYTGQVQYSVNKTEWTDTPEFGKIFVRCNDRYGNFVMYKQLINIGGDSLEISFPYSDENICNVQMAWTHGTILPPSLAERNADNSWKICKDNCEKNRIKFTFIPEQSPSCRFSITLKVPFKSCSVMDGEQHAMTGRDNVVPYCDIIHYKYRFVGLQNDVEYRFGDERRIIRYDRENNRINIIRNDTAGRTVLRELPSEGGILNLFDSPEQLRILLEQTSENIVHARVHMEFMDNADGTLVGFDIKDFPYKIIQSQEDINRVQICNAYSNRQIDYRYSLKLFDIKKPFREPQELKYDEEQGYVIPAEIRDWGKALLVGCLKGHILPKIISFSGAMSNEERAANRENALKDIRDEINEAKIGDTTWKRIIKWFDRTREEAIPASSLLELVCVAEKPEALVCFVFQLYSDSDRDRDSLAMSLKTFSEELGFDWFWLKNTICNAMQIINSYSCPQDIDSTFPVRMRIQWAMQQENVSENIKAVVNPETIPVQFYSDIIKEFVDWMKKVCRDSMLDNYHREHDETASDIADNIMSGEIGYIEPDRANLLDYNQPDIDEETNTYFGNYGNVGLADNELWMYQRVRAVAAYLTSPNDDNNLFIQSERIRRSIIFCRKSCFRQFIIKLNNELVQHTIE